MSFASALDGKKYGQKAIDTFLWWSDEPGLPAKSSLFDLIPPGEQGMRIARAAAALAQRDWLCRTWVQQEAGVCWDTRVMCGQQEISWNQFFSVLWLLKRRSSGEWPDWLNNDELATEIGIHAVMEIQRSRFYHITYPRLISVRSRTTVPAAPYDPYTDAVRFTRPFGDMLSVYSACKASDPRDKIYAVYSIYGTYRHQSRNRPPVDYKISWQALYMEVVKWLVKDGKTGYLGLLDNAGRCQQTGQDLPSWVPDLRYPIEALFTEHGQWSAARAHSAVVRFLTLPRPKPGEPALPQYTFVDQSGKRKRLPNVAVQLQCLLMDRICYQSALPLAPHDHITQNLEGVQARISENLKHVKMHVLRYMTGETAEEAFAGTIIASTTHLDQLSTRAYESGFAEFHRWVNSGAANPEPEYWCAVRQSAVLCSFPFCATAHALMCLVPKVCKQGDYVAILAGFRWPVALRKVGEPSWRQSELLGPCYIHRMMRERCLGLVDESRSRYCPGSEDES